MVFEFDYVPLSIGLIGQYAPGAAEAGPAPPATDLEPELPATPPASTLAAERVTPLELSEYIPIWNEDAKTLQNEYQSPLLRLPAELKLKIWAMVYEDVRVHMICRPDGKVGHFLCDETTGSSGVRDGELWPPTDVHYVQCRCKGSLLEPPYKQAPLPEQVKTRRESMPSRDGLERVGGMLLACREIYANARLYLYTQPTFIFPTQRLIPRFASSLHPTQLALIQHLTVHTWSDSWRTMSASGFFGGSSDHAAPQEWAAARQVITSLPSLDSLHLIVHVAGGDSTIWYDDCKPAGCVKALDSELRSLGRMPRRHTDPLPEAVLPRDDSDEGDGDVHELKASVQQHPGKAVRCQATAAVESSRHGPGVTGSWVTYQQAKNTDGRPMYRERNVQILRELELEMPEGWELSWWVSMEEREKGAQLAGPAPWPFNHIPL